jgi:hypothetical protein
MWSGDYWTADYWTGDYWTGTGTAVPAPLIYGPGHFDELFIHHPGLRETQIHQPGLREVEVRW